MSAIILLNFYISTLISQLSQVYLFKKISNLKINLTKINYLILAIVPLIQVILKNFASNNILPFLTIIYFTYLFKVLFDCKIKEAINYGIIIWVISISLDMLIMGLMNLLNVENYNDFYSQIFRAISTLIMSLSLILIGNNKNILKFINRIYTKIDKINIKWQYIFIITILLFTIEMTIFKNMDDGKIILTSICLCIVLIWLIIKFISLYYEILTLKATNEILERNIDANLELINQYRVLKHNLENNLLGIKSISNKKTKQLIDALIEEYNSKCYIKYDISSLPSGINGFILEKLYKYSNDDLKISINNKIKSKMLESLGPRNYNSFCEALGITLDNALEACIKTEDKLLYLEFKEGKDSITIKVMNTFSGNIELDRLGTKEYTSKKEGHGLGLYSLFNRKNIVITTSIKNNLFINVIKVKKQKEKYKY